MLKYMVKVQINYPIPFMTIKSDYFCRTYSDKDAAYRDYNALVDKYLMENGIIVKITLNKYDANKDAEKEDFTASIIEFWSNMDE